MAKIAELPGLALTLVIIAAVMGVGALVLDKLYNQVNSSNAQSIISQGQSAVSDMSGWLGTIVVVIMGAIVIKVLVEAFRGKEA